MSSPSRLRLARPLVAFDLETTGLSVTNDRIVEMSCVKLHPDGTREVRTRRVNPERPISAEATAVHGISNEDVVGEPTFAQVAKGLYAFFEGADLTGFNIEQFDLPLLAHEFARVGMTFPPQAVQVIDSWRIFLTKEPRDLSAAYRYYCGATLENAHSAEADAVAAAEILLAQVSRYEDLPADIDDLHAFCHPVHPDWLDPDGRIVWRQNRAVLNFGKHRDQPLDLLAKTHPDYLRWMATSDFSQDVVRIVSAALKGELPAAPQPVRDAS